MAILIVLPILFVLMYDLGLSLGPDDFKRVLKAPRPLILGTLGQLILLPVIAFLIGTVFNLSPVYFLGLMLIACCPGGSSSNIFSMLAKGDVALSVSLTTVSSVVTLFTMPLILNLRLWGSGAEGVNISLPVTNLLMQNAVTMLLPVILGIITRRYAPKAAGKIERALSKTAFPALVILATIFFVQNRAEISANIGELGVCTALLMVAACFSAALLCRIFRTTAKIRRTLVIEIGMQNAAQAIALAASPFVFGNALIAMPAVLYAMFMNLILLVYIAPAVFGLRPEQVQNS